MDPFLSGISKITGTGASESSIIVLSTCFASDSVIRMSPILEFRKYSSKHLFVSSGDFGTEHTWTPTILKPVTVSLSPIAAISSLGIWTAS